VHDGISDALTLRNGIIKWWQEKKIEVKYSEHTGLDEMAFAQLVQDDDVEVIAHTQHDEEMPGPDGQMVQVPLHDVKIKRKETCSRPKLASVAPEHFLIHPDALSMLDSPIIGENYRIRRSDLVAMGYDRKKVEALPMEVPDRFEVDITELAIGDSLRVGDIRPPEGVTILDDPEAVVLNVTPPTKIEEPEVEEAEELEEGELPEGVEAEEGAEPEAEGESAEAEPDESE